MKITILGWDLIGEVIAGNFNILKITQEVSVISAAQEFKINCDCFSETILTAILDDLEDNFRGKNPIELYSLLDKLGKIKIKDENLKKKFMNQKEICNEWIAKSIKIDASLINADTVYLNIFLANLKYESSISKQTSGDETILFDLYS